MPTAPQRGNRLPPLSRSCVAFEIEEAWLRICKRNPKFGPTLVSITPRGKVLLGYDADRYSNAVEVGRFTHTITLADLRDEVFHVWEKLQR